MFTKIAAISVELHTGNMQKIIPKLYYTVATESQALHEEQQAASCSLANIHAAQIINTASKLLLLPLPKPKLCKNFFL
jgi:hypothetical protein